MNSVLRYSLIAVLGATSLLAVAQTTQSYNVSHNFWVNPGQGVIVPLGLVQWRDFEHAWAISRQAAVASWNPAGQHLVFNRFGRDFLLANGAVWNTGGVFVNQGNTLYLGPPWPFVRQNNVFANAGTAWADAHASVLVNQFLPGGPFWGNTRAWGSASAIFQGDSAYAFSTSQLQLTGLTVNWRTGRIRWQPLLQSTVGGSAFARGIRRYDPIWFGDEFRRESFFDIFLEEEGGDTEATLNWENDRLIHQGKSDVTIDIDMTHQVILPSDHGRFRVRTLGGVVVESIASGRFHGMGPALGSSDQFNLPLPSDIEFGYEIPTICNEFEIGFGGAGEMTAVPEPSSLLTVGLAALLLLRRRR